MNEGRTRDPEAGKLGGLCYRTACQGPGAVWYNDSTREHYCRTCAKLINKASLEMIGRELCKEVG